MDINRTENIPKERFHTFKVWGKMLPYIKPYRKWVAAIAAAMLLEAFIAVMDTLIAAMWWTASLPSVHTRGYPSSWLYMPA